MKVTHWTFLVASLALAAILPFAGFWSKDEILAGAAQGGGGDNAYTIVLVMGVITAFLTAAYMGRAYWMTFRGEYRGHVHPHESPAVMTWPLRILAIFSLLIGLVNLPSEFFGLKVPENFALRFEHFVQPTFAFPPELVPPKFTAWLAILSLVLAFAGGAVGILYYRAHSNPLRGLTERNAVARWGYYVLENKYGLDGLYFAITNAVRFQIAAAMYWINMKVIDGVVNAVGIGARAVGRFTYRFIDQGVVDNIVNGSGAASQESGQFLRRMQTGKVQEYASLLFGGVIVLAIIFIITIR